LIEAVIPKSKRIDGGGTLRVVPLHAGEINAGMVARPPIWLSDRLAVNDETSVSSEVILGVDGVPLSNMDINFSECAVDVVIGVETAGNIRARGTIAIESSLKCGRKIEDRVTRGSIAIGVES